MNSMKQNKIIISCLLLIFLSGSPALLFAQQESEEKPEQKFFRKEKLFTGGNLNLAFGNYVTVLGINPHFGISLNRFADVAFTANFNYTSQRDYYIPGDKVRQNMWGPGAFVRLFPLKFLFAQAQYEHNFIRLKYLPAENSNFIPEKNRIEANSLLVGGGYCTGRAPGNNTYFYFSIMWDVAGAANSPYLDYLGRSVPIIRAGVNVALFQGKGNSIF